MDQHLGLLKSGYAIAGYRWESFKLRLADRSWFCPDFYVLHNDGSIEIIEVKGRQFSTGMTKFRVAAELYPEYTFTMVSWTGGTWKTVIKVRGEGRRAIPV